MKIAIIGWGSLICSRGELKLASEWHCDGPLLPVEFARQSNRDRLTLVIVDWNIEPCKTYWAESAFSDINQAIKDLAKREQTNTTNIHYASKNKEDGFSKGTRQEIRDAVTSWIREKASDYAIWTGLERNMSSSEAAISYLRDLVHRGEAKNAEEYVRKAPIQIDTPLRRQIANEFGWVGLGQVGA